MSKSLNAYKTIGEVVKIIGLKSKKGQSLPTHTIRFGRQNLSRYDLKYLMAIEDTMMKNL